MPRTLLLLSIALAAAVPHAQEPAPASPSQSPDKQGPDKQSPDKQSPDKQSPDKQSPDKWDVSAPHGPGRDVTLDLHEGTWMDLDVSPDGKTIVFDLLGDVWTVPIEGGDAKPLLQGPAFTVQPRFSPDGEKIAFTSDAGGGDNLWVMNADGSDPRPVTKESFRLLNNPAWTADGRYLIGRKHFTSTRSLGAGELWLYDLEGGSGVQLTVKKNDQQDTGEPETSPDGRYVYYSEDVSPGPAFEYNRDPNGVIYAIKRLDLRSGDIETVCSAPGGSARPELSPDGSRLAFVRRVRGETVLMVRDLATGDEHRIYRPLSTDQQESWCIFGVYPNFAWTPDAAAIVVWARGVLHRIAVASGEAREIPFRAVAHHHIRDALRQQQDLGAAQQPVRVLRWPCVLPGGDRVVFQALGHLWIRGLAAGSTPERLTDDGDLEYWPRLSADGKQLVYTTWNDARGGQVMLLDLASRARRALVDEPGHYVAPRFDAAGARVIYQRLGSGSTRGEAFTGEPGLYVVTLETGERRRVRKGGGGPMAPRFDPRDPERILFLGREGDDTALVSIDLLGGHRRLVVSSHRATEIELSPSGDHVAWAELFHVYLSPMPAVPGAVHLAPDRKDLPVRKLTEDGGEFVSFSADGGHVWHGLAATLQRDGVASADDRTRYDLGFSVPADRPATDVVLENARLITMEGDEIIEDGAIHVRGNRIAAIGRRGEIDAAGARHFDLGGRTVLPGFLDVHAHMPSGNAGMLPQANWPYLANLAFGVTTTHDPSHDTKMVFAASELVNTGRMLGPRITSTGTVLYGAESNFKAVINSLDDARHHLRRLKAYGAFSAKSYNQPRREQRQQVITAAAELGMMVVPEGGSMFFHNLTMILDGHTTIEHALPVAPLYEDVLQLFAASHTAYDPTLVVGYGGLWGENYWYATTDVWKNEHLLTFVPRSLVDPRSRRRNIYPQNELHHIDLAHSAAELARRGVPVSVSAHGQMQGICSHWDLWMFQQGGLTNHEALRTATIWPARALGFDQQVGSLRAGKLADLLVLDADPLEDIHNSQKIHWVMKNGRLYEAATLRQVLPDERPAPVLPFLHLMSQESGRCADTTPDGH